jgi:nucleoside-diphosphate-sugar epimerase
MTRSFWRDRPVLVTGATGLVCAWLTRHLHDAGADVVCLVLNQASNELRRQYLSAERARQMLAWSPLFTLDTGIGTISWYRDFLSGGQ